MAIELKNICQSFGAPPKIVLNNVSVTLRDGFTFIMGHSGVGKTTLIHIIAGLVKPDTGEISGVAGKKISMVFQEDRLLEWESALNNVLFVKNDPARAMELLNAAGLSESVNKKTAALSGGMKRRVCLCRALIADYDILILDEPFKGLDADLKPAVMEMTKNAARGIIICVTHDRTEAEFFGGEIITLQ